MRRRSPKFDSVPSLREELDELLYREIKERIEPSKLKELEIWKLNNKGIALANLGKPNEAIYAYKKFIEFAPAYIALQIERVKEYIRQHKGMD